MTSAMVLALVAVERLQKLQHLQLVGHVQVGGGLVQKDEARVLGERHGDPGALALAAGKGVDGARGEVAQMRDGKGPVDDALIVVGQAPEALLVRIAAQRHQLAHSEPRRRLGRLGQQRHPAGHLGRGHLGDGASVQVHRAAAQGHGARERLQKRGLPAAVRPDDGGDLAGGHGHVHGLYDDAVAVAHRHGLAAQGRVGEFLAGAVAGLAEQRLIDDFRRFRSAFAEGIEEIRCVRLLHKRHLLLGSRQKVQEIGRADDGRHDADGNLVGSKQRA